MGLPVKKIVASVNDNDAFPKFLATGHYQKISPSRNSVSNAMNVGHPSNLARLVAVYGGQMDETGKINKLPDLAAMRRDIFSTSISDERTVTGVREFWNSFQLLLEPHGSVAWQGFQDWNARQNRSALHPQSSSRPPTRQSFRSKSKKSSAGNRTCQTTCSPRCACQKISTAWTRIMRSSATYLIERHKAA